MKETPELLKLTALIHYVHCPNIMCNDCAIENICRLECHSVAEARQMIEDNK